MTTKQAEKLVGRLVTVASFCNAKYRDSAEQHTGRVVGMVPNTIHAALELNIDGSVWPFTLKHLDLVDVLD